MDHILAKAEVNPEWKNLVDHIIHSNKEKFHQRALRQLGIDALSQLHPEITHKSDYYDPEGDKRKILDKKPDPYL